MLFIVASKDLALGPALSKDMDKVVPNLTKREVVAGHWALIEAAKQVNEHIREWFDGVVFAGAGASKSTL